MYNIFKLEKQNSYNNHFGPFSNRFIIISPSGFVSSSSCTLTNSPQKLGVPEMPQIYYIIYMSL